MLERNLCHGWGHDCLKFVMKTSELLNYTIKGIAKTTLGILSMMIL